MAIAIPWPGNFLWFTEKKRDGTYGPDEHRLYLLNELLHEMADRLSARATTFTATGTGFTATITSTARFMLFGDLCVLNIPQLSGTSNTTAFTITGLPSIIRPVNISYAYIRTTDNGTDARGIATLSAASSTITLNTADNLAAWTASGTKTFYAHTFTYLIG